MCFLVINGQKAGLQFSFLAVIISRFKCDHRMFWETVLPVFLAKYKLHRGLFYDLFNWNKCFLNRTLYWISESNWPFLRKKSTTKVYFRFMSYRRIYNKCNLFSMCFEFLSLFPARTPKIRLKLQIFNGNK